MAGSQTVDPLVSAAQRRRILLRHHGPDDPRVREAGRLVEALKAERHLQEVREHVRRTRAEQGLPPVITDEMTLAKVAELFRAPAEPAPA